MNRQARALVLVVVTATFGGNLARAAEEAGTDVPVTGDLTSVIALQGLPCGKVVSAREQGKDDYLASCQDGNRYRVYVNAEGRVVIERR